MQRGDDVAGRLAAIERRLEHIGIQLGALDRLRDRLGEVHAAIKALVELDQARPSGCGSGSPHPGPVPGE